MKKNNIVAVYLAVVASTTLWATPVADIYKNRCANCHGDKANGVSKLAPKQESLEVKEAASKGISTGSTLNANGIPLNHLTQEDLLEKLINLRKADDGVDTMHSVMRKNLKTIETREGKISDKEMAEYIYNTFGAGSK